MSTFKLSILTPDSMFFEGEVERLVVRTLQGDIGVLPKHAAYVAPLEVGMLKLKISGEQHVAAIAGGFIDVSTEQTTILTATCEWAKDIDVSRAMLARDRAREILEGKQDRANAKLAEYKLKKAMNRINVSGHAGLH